jgi:hypothetical protein
MTHPTKPLTDTQLARNQANAQKSTGPRTPEGKRNSSQNAISHGFLARSILLPGESAARFHALLASYSRRFRPASQDEHDLVETMAVCRWRLLRIWTLESSALSHEQRQQSASTAHEEPPTQIMLAARALDHPPRSQEALARHEVRLDRAWHRAADRLREIQAARKKEEPERTQQLTENKQTSPKNEPPANHQRTGNEPITNPGRTPHFKAFICVHLCESVAPLSSSNSLQLTTTHSYFIIDSEPIAAQAVLAEFISTN